MTSHSFIAIFLYYNFISYVGPMQIKKIANKEKSKLFQFNLIFISYQFITFSNFLLTK